METETNSVPRIAQRNRTKLYHAIASLSDFDASAMKGRQTLDNSVGRLEEPHRSVYRKDMYDCSYHGGMYVVYSYATPIAWYSIVRGGWYIVDDSFSQSTSRHQTIVRVAVDS